LAPILKRADKKDANPHPDSNPFFYTTWGWGDEKIEKKKATNPEELRLIFTEP
jgi:hypothetical protein